MLILSLLKTIRLLTISKINIKLRGKFHESKEKKVEKKSFIINNFNINGSFNHETSREWTNNK